METSAHDVDAGGASDEAVGAEDESRLDLGDVSTRLAAIDSFRRRTKQPKPIETATSTARDLKYSRDEVNRLLERTTHLETSLSSLSGRWDDHVAEWDHVLDQSLGNVFPDDEHPALGTMVHKEMLGTDTPGADAVRARNRLLRAIGLEMTAGRDGVCPLERTTLKHYSREQRESDVFRALLARALQPDPSFFKPLAPALAAHAMSAPSTGAPGARRPSRAHSFARLGSNRNLFAGAPPRLLEQSFEDFVAGGSLRPSASSINHVCSVGAVHDELVRAAVATLASATGLPSRTFEPVELPRTRARNSSAPLPSEAKPAPRAGGALAAGPGPSTEAVLAALPAEARAGPEGAHAPVVLAAHASYRQQPPAAEQPHVTLVLVGQPAKRGSPGRGARATRTGANEASLPPAAPRGYDAPVPDAAARGRARSGTKPSSTTAAAMASAGASDSESKAVDAQAPATVVLGRTVIITCPREATNVPTARGVDPRGVSAESIAGVVLETFRAVAVVGGIDRCSAFRCVNATAREHTCSQFCPVCLRKLLWATSLAPHEHYLRQRDVYTRHAAKFEAELRWLERRVQYLNCVPGDGGSPAGARTGRRHTEPSPAKHAAMAAAAPAADRRGSV